MKNFATRNSAWNDNTGLVIPDTHVLRSNAKKRRYPGLAGVAKPHLLDPGSLSSQEDPNLRWDDVYYQDLRICVI